MPIILSPTVSNPSSPTAVTSSDGFLTVTADDVYAGALLKADFSSLGTKPLKVRFTRDGSVSVRSGDPAWAPGGVAYAYDHEVSLGGASSWTATPIFADGTAGTTSTSASVSLAEMDDAVDCWVKPLNDPGLSVAFPVHTDKIEESWTARLDLSVVPGRAYPTGNYDVRTPAPISITMRTTTKAEKTALRDALNVGTVLVQLRGTYGIDSFYALPGDATARYFLGMFSQIRDFPVSFTPVDRPPTIDSPSFYPGHSFADAKASAATYTDSAASWPLFKDALESIYSIPAGITEESGGGGDEGGA